ncbi:MAG: hypothetical protein RIT81_08550 [Deltaproteobacteria bacterium]
MASPGGHDANTAWRFACRHLTRAELGGSFSWQPGGLAAIERRLLRRVRGPDAVAEVADLLKLASALRRRLGSVEAADALSLLLKRTPEAVAIVRAHWGTGAQRRAIARFSSRTGQDPRRRAPSVGQRPEPGAVPLATLLDPTERDRRRARTRRNTGVHHGGQRRRI